MGRLTSSGVAAAVVLGVLSLLQAPVAPASNPSTDEALTDLNAFRELAGVPPVASMNPAYNDGCMKHNRYMHETGEFDHDEDPDSPWYSEEGNAAAGSSVLAGGQQLPRAAWEYAVYHRTLVLAPRLQVSGYDASSANTCMRTRLDDELAGAIPETEAYPWPADGMTDVPLRFTGGEVPDPCDAVASPCRLGYLLSIVLNGPWRYVEGVRVASASIAPDGGAPVRVLARDSYNDVFQYEAAAAIFPVEPLEPGTWYTASASGEVVEFAEWEGEPEREFPFEVSWRFRTTGSPESDGEACAEATRRARAAGKNLKKAKRKLRRASGGERRKMKRRVKSKRAKLRAARTAKREACK